MTRETLLTIGAVVERVGMGRSTIYKQIKQGIFPAPSKRGRSSCWPESTINAYIEDVATGKMAA